MDILSSLTRMVKGIVPEPPKLVVTTVTFRTVPTAPVNDPIGIIGGYVRHHQKGTQTLQAMQHQQNLYENKVKEQILLQYSKLSDGEYLSVGDLNLQKHLSEQYKYDMWKAQQL